MTFRGLAVIVLIIGCIITGTPLIGQSSYLLIGNSKILNPNILDEEGVDRAYTVRIQTKSGISVYSPDDVSEFKTTDGDIFISYGSVDSTKVFLQNILEGELGLLYYMDKNYNDRFFLSDKNGDIIELNEDEKSPYYFKTILKQTWFICIENNALIDETYYLPGSLKRTIRSHNKCKKGFTPRKQLSILAGVNYGSIKIDYNGVTDSRIVNTALNNSTFDNSTSFWIESLIELPIARSPVVFTTGLLMYHMKFHGTAFWSINKPRDATYVIDMSLLNLAIPIGFQYAFQLNKFQPFVGAGISIDYFIGNKLDVVETYHVVPPRVLELQETIEPLGVGYYGFMGVKHVLKEHSSLFLKVGLSGRKSLGENYQYGFNGAYVLAGISFDLEGGE